MSQQGKWPAGVFPLRNSEGKTWAEVRRTADKAEGYRRAYGGAPRRGLFIPMPTDSHPIAMRYAARRSHAQAPDGK